MIGIIYKITCNKTGENYYGSTTTTLEKRKYFHKKYNKTCISKQIIDRGDWDIIELEKIEFNDKKELLKRETYYIKNFNCINIIRSYITEKERKQHKINYHKSEFHKNYQKQYYIKNKNYQNRKLCCIKCREELQYQNLKRHYKRKHT
jgi:hypothetical protein